MVVLFIANLLFIWGLWKAFHPDYVLGGVRNWIVRTSAKVLKDKTTYLMKPLTDCVVCMSSIWSIPFYLYSGFDLILWPVWVICLAGASTILNR